MSRRFELHRADDAYPSCLRDSPRPPATLYGVGDPTVLEAGLGIVGSRKATPYGLSCARKFASWAARRHLLVVSGGAIGCDQEAHKAALAEGGRTVVVLGCGADVDYPRGARGLFREIRSTGACVSELPWGTHPTRYNFVNRNRLIAALSSALLVVEAGLPSGTFSTADFALEAGRDVLAVPGSIFAAECRGANRLIRQGATPITDVSELAEALGVPPETPSLTTDPHGTPALDPASGSLLEAVRADPMRPDDLARALDLDIVSVVRSLGLLESAGVVARYPDGRYGPA